MLSLLNSSEPSGASAQSTGRAKIEPSVPMQLTSVLEAVDLDHISVKTPLSELSDGYKRRFESHSSMVAHADVFT